MKRLILQALVVCLLLGAASGQDVLRELQVQSVRDKAEAKSRIYAFGWHGLDGVFSTHTSHSNRLVPVLAFSKLARFDAFTGPNSVYRDREQLAAIYGRTPPRSVDASALHADQSDVNRLLRAAIDRGAKRVVVLLMDGGDWQTYAAASIVKSGSYDPQGIGRGLAFFDYRPPMPDGEDWRSNGVVVTSPYRASTVVPGYDASRGGVWPWSPQDAEYLAGDYLPRESTKRATAHAVVDSAASATAIFSGRKTVNGAINVSADGKPIQPLGRELQARGFAIATVTDVPFGHASPASVYASVQKRRMYHEIGRQMLGLSQFRGADVVLGYGQDDEERYFKAEDLSAVRDAGRYRVVAPSIGENGREMLAAGARAVAKARREVAAQEGRLFGFFGKTGLDHAPYRTADGGYNPSPSVNGKVESYDRQTLEACPDLQSMTRAAITVLEATPERPFLLFVESGLVDWSLHANNLDHAVGEVMSAEATFTILTDWITARGWWEETIFVVTSDHGHLLQVNFDALRGAVQGR